MALFGIKPNKCLESTYQPIYGQYLFPSIDAGESATYTIDASTLDLPNDEYSVIYAEYVLQVGDTYKPYVNVRGYYDYTNNQFVIVCENNGSSTIDTTLVHYVIL